MARRSIENLEKRELMTAAPLVDDSASALNSEEFHNATFIDVLSRLGGDDQFGYSDTVNRLGGHEPFVIGSVGNDELTEIGQSTNSEDAQRAIDHLMARMGLLDSGEFLIDDVSFSISNVRFDDAYVVHSATTLQMKYDDGFVA